MCLAGDILPLIIGGTDVYTLRLIDKIFHYFGQALNNENWRSDIKNFHIY